ncbi:uncharacterized protein PGTG_14379 [Puccinia graminis f. sp. tritici CRL 75-36-700-3]|uniref:Uncharacterized protein n=1 Tax=Puccinia graminis f. sp. tritici (strain CRL 75-36-700-3 / race SCCL) TaxID=418459 RepID=E3KVS9_PUCGT|nr:uncharacterized protein PGTG_14379 [Puccinia graminis f. sp. tritici CRL 75-36-700-3]EFP88295.1 hypothetical protein PGTG_14379 [Puccinia graminis f. sp. tritici CRL 75-36-700-3]
MVKGYPLQIPAIRRRYPLSVADTRYPLADTRQGQRIPASSDGSSSESESTDSSSSSSSSSGSSINRPTVKRGRLAKKQNLQARALQPQDGGDPTNPQSMRRSPSPVEQLPPPPLPSSFFDPDLALPYLDSSPDITLALDDHQLVLQSLDLAKQTLHLDPSICPQPVASPQSHEDVEMSDGADS